MRETSLYYLDQNGTVHKLSLPVKDKKRLFALMQNLFAEDNFAYTVLGSKPISWATYHNPWPFDREWFRESFSEYNRTLRLGWKTWEKYRHLFPSADLWSENPQCYPSSTSILIVNKERFNAVVKNHKKDFQDVLQREVIDGSQLLKEAKNCSLMNEVLEGHQALLGIVLGYGRDNAWQFLEKCEKKGEPIGWVWDEEYKERLGEIIYYGPAANTIEEILSFYSCPSFAGDPHSEESMALKWDYLHTREKVLNYYKGKDFLEATLSLLAGYRPSE